MPGRGQDRLLIVSEFGLFGVFDGVTTQAGEQAATIARDCLVRSVGRHMLLGKSLFDVQNKLYDMHRKGKVEKRAATTATVVQIDTHDHTLTYAHIGDTFLRQVKEDFVEDLVKAEGVGDWIWNAIDASPPEMFSLEQNATIPIKPGDRFILGSDGIDGSGARQIALYEDFNAIARLPKAKDVAKGLISLCAQEPPEGPEDYYRLYDDKSVIVIDVH